MAIFVCGILTFFIGFIVLCFLSDDISEAMLCLIISSFGGVLMGLSFTELKQENLLTPLDVYRGKTTLEITYRDSVAIDSVVVFKNK